MPAQIRFGQNDSFPRWRRHSFFRVHQSLGISDQWIFFSEYFLGCANLSEYWISEWQWKNLISRVSSTQWNQNIHVTFMTFVTFIYVTFVTFVTFIFVTFIFVNIQGWCQKLAPLSKSKLDNRKIWFQEDQTIIKYYELFCVWYFGWKIWDVKGVEAPVWILQTKLCRTHFSPTFKKEK